MLGGGAVPRPAAEDIGPPKKRGQLHTRIWAMEQLCLHGAFSPATQKVARVSYGLYSVIRSCITEAERTEP